MVSPVPTANGGGQQGSSAAGREIRTTGGSRTDEFGCAEASEGV
jgi:hypothetical protein